MMKDGRLEVSRRNGTAGGINILGVLFVVFLVLKLAPPVQTWSWWWVTAPLWLPIAAALVLTIGKAVH